MILILKVYSKMGWAVFYCLLKIKLFFFLQISYDITRYANEFKIEFIQSQLLMISHSSFMNSSVLHFLGSGPDENNVLQNRGGNFRPSKRTNVRTSERPNPQTYERPSKHLNVWNMFTPQLNFSHEHQLPNTIVWTINIK